VDAAGRARGYAQGMAPRTAARTGTIVVGVVLVVVGLLIAFGFRVGSCVDGPDVSTCTSGPAPYALAIGFAVAVIGAVVVWREARKRRG